MRILYRADGSPEIGTGHIVRGLILRRRLEALGAQVTFLTRDLPWGPARLREAGCEVLPIAGDADETEALRAALTSISPDACIMDILETGQTQTAAVREAGCGLVCLDDVGPGRLNAHAIVNILEVDPAPEVVAERDIALYEGPEYAALVDEYAQPDIAQREIPRKVRHILITLGGADPAGLIPKAARAVKTALSGPRGDAAFEDARVLLLVGSASDQHEQAQKAVAGAEAQFTIETSVPSLLPALRRADIGVIAGGLTMHEALAVGLPCIALCQFVRHQAELAQRLSDRGAMLTLGPGAAVSEEVIAAQVLALAADWDLRRRLAARGPQLVDGHGAQRVGRVIAEVASGAATR